MPTAFVQKPGAPIKWEHGENKTCWNTRGLDFHYVLHASRVQGIGKPFFPAPPRGTIFGSSQKVPTYGFAKCVGSLLADDKRKEFMASLPDTVRSFFICKRESKENGCFSNSVMKGHIIGGDKIEIVSGSDIARMQRESKKVREAMQAFRAQGRYVNGRFADKKENFTIKHCDVVDNKVVCKDLMYTPDQYGDIRLVVGLSQLGDVVDAVYVVKGLPAIVLARDLCGTKICKEFPSKGEAEKAVRAAPSGKKVFPMRRTDVAPVVQQTGILFPAPA